MRLNQFEMIVALENCESLSEASEKLYISQPSISKAIRELEEEVGYTILKRTKNGVQFTELGNQVLCYAKEIMERIERVKQLGLKVDENICGKILLGATRFWGSDIFSLVILGLKEQYPNVTIQFQEDFSSSIVENVRNEQLDFGIIMLYSTDEEETLHYIESQNLQYQRLFADHVGLYANMHHELHKKTEIYMKDVMEYPYVTGGNAAVANSIAEFFHSYGYKREIEIISNRQMRLQYLLTHNVFTSMPERAYAGSIESQKMLKRLPVLDLHWDCQVGVVYRRENWNNLKETVLKRLQEIGRAHV